MSEISRIVHLPALPPKESFSHDFYWHIADTYWNDDSLVTLTHAATHAAETLPASKLEEASSVLDDIDDARIQADPDRTVTCWIDMPALPTSRDERDIVIAASTAHKTHLYHIRHLLGDRYVQLIAGFLGEYELDQANRKAHGCDEVANLTSFLPQEIERRTNLAHGAAKDMDFDRHVEQAVAHVQPAYPPLRLVK